MGGSVRRGRGRVPETGRSEVMSAAGTSEAAAGTARSLSLAAAPTFAIMALLTHFDGGPLDALCSTGSALHLGGMVPMYLLMGAFHSAPWLGLIGGRRSAS